MPDPRLQRSRSKVLDAAQQLLRELGSAGLTVEAVAQRSGVAKSTIYRQFADADEIHVAAIGHNVEHVAMPADGGVVADVSTMLQALAAKLCTGDFAAVMLSAVEKAERSEHMNELMSQMIRARRGPMVRRLRLAITRGELLASTDADLLATQLAGPIFYRRFFGRQPVSKAFVTRLVTTTMTPLLAKSAT